MSYSVTVNGKTSDTTSFDAAKNVVKAGVNDFAARLSQPVPFGVFRSAKHTTRVNAERQRSAVKLVSGVKLPKTAGDVSGSVGGLNFSIAKR